MTEPSVKVSPKPGYSWLARNWIYAPVLVCVLIMLPRLISAQFGLMDDGRALTIAQGLLHGKFDLSWDVIAGRARPIYWAAFAFWYLLVGGQPFWYFLGNLIVFSATTFLLIHLVDDLGGTKPQAFLTGVIFVFSTSVIEDIYTLSKAENFQLLLMISAISLVILGARSITRTRLLLFTVFSALLLLVACFTKEATLLLLPISLVWWSVAILGRWRQFSSAPFVEKASRLLIYASLASSVVFYVGRTIFLASSKILGVGQSSEFFFDRQSIINGVIRWGGWLLRDFIWLLPMALMVIVWCMVKKRLPRSGLWWMAGVWMAFWLGMYIPWHFAVEYYLLPFAAGTAVLSGVLLVEIWELVTTSGRIWKGFGIASLVMTVTLLLATQANSFTDASIQLAQDSANARVLRYVAENAPQGSQVVVNIQLANEYIEQMQLMLANYYNRPDLELVNYQGQDLSTFKDQPRGTYFLLAELVNQPKMTVRMGLDEPSLKVWNASVMPQLASWNEVFRVTMNPPILAVNFPRLLCPVINRGNFCAAGSKLIDNQPLLYQWSVYTP